MVRRLGLLAGLVLLVCGSAAVAWLGEQGDRSVEPGDDSGGGGGAGAQAPPPALGAAGVGGRGRGAPTVPEGRAAAGVGARTRRVAGRVLDADGQPVPGALVREVVRPEGSALTDEAGRFALEVGVDPDAGLVVTAEGYADVFVRADAAGGALGIALARGAAITGTVRDAESGEPLVGVPVRATPSTSPEAVEARVAEWREDGTFRVTVPKAGTYVLDVGARNVGADVTARDEWVPTRVEGVVAGKEAVEVRLARGRAIDGTLIDDVGEAVTRRVKVDAVRRTAAGDPDFTMRKIVFAEAGAFRVPGLSPGGYDLWVIPDAAAGDVEGARLSSTVVRAVEAGTRGLVVRLSRGFTLSGRLDDGAGTPVTGPGKVVAYRAGDPERNHPVVGEVPGDGTFLLGPLDDGYRYDVHATGFAGRRPGLVAGVNPRDVGVVVALPAARGIGGRVLGEDGKPVPAGVPVGLMGEGIDVRSSGARTFAYTKEDGTFLADGLPELEFTVEAGGGRSGYLGTVLRGVKAGTTDLALRVTLGVELSGVLVDAKGDPVETTSLSADDGARLAAMRPYAQVGADGKFVLRGLRAGRVRLAFVSGPSTVDAGIVEAPASALRIVVPGR